MRQTNKRVWNTKICNRLKVNNQMEFREGKMFGLMEEQQKVDESVEQIKQGDMGYAKFRRYNY